MCATALALWIVLAGLAAFYLAPLIFIGPPGYPANGYRGALLAVAVSSIVGVRHTPTGGGHPQPRLRGPLP